MKFKITVCPYLYTLLLVIFSNSIIEAFTLLKNDHVDQESNSITIFVPTKEFYEQNKKNLLSLATFNGHPICIPEDFKDEKDENTDYQFDRNIPWGDGFNGGDGIGGGYDIGINVATEGIDQDDDQDKLSYKNHPSNIAANIGGAAIPLAIATISAPIAIPLAIATTIAYINIKSYQDYMTKKSIAVEPRPTRVTTSPAPHQKPTILKFPSAPDQAPTMLPTPQTYDPRPTILITLQVPEQLLSDTQTSFPDHDISTIWQLNDKDSLIMFSGAPENETSQVVSIDGHKQTDKEKRDLGTKVDVIAGVAGAAIGTMIGGANIGVSIGLGSGVGGSVATISGVTITGPAIPIIVGGIVVGYGIKLSIDLITHHVKQKRLEKATAKQRENDSNRNNSSGPDKDPDKEPKNKNKELPAAATAHEIKKKIENILKDTIPGRETSGKSKQYIKNGCYEDAIKDFESLGPSNIRKMQGKEGMVGTLPDGRTINVRIGSTDKRPTLEILPGKDSRRIIKIRYGANQP
jgi:hypothetical protein